MNTCFAFDLDGTVTRQELLPLIAGALDLEKEMRLLTQLTIQGLIPFEDSFRLRCACLKSASIKEVQSIVADAALDKDILRFIQKHPTQCAIVTGNLDIWIAPLAEKLGCRSFSSTATINHGQLCNISSVLRKNHPILELKKTFDRVVAIGDGLNDMPMFDAADIRIAFGGVHSPAKPLVQMADFVTFSGSALCRMLNTLL
ncbi:MAG: HAD-IB family phosphatase [Methylophilaceae bacterium]